LKIMDLEKISAVVVGGLGTDIFALGLNRLVGPGELSLGGELRLGAGGKSRNIAEMLARFMGAGRVAIVGRTSQDPLNLWRVPVDALTEAGVNVQFTKVLPFAETGKYPQIALIAVDRQGNNQIYVVPGITEDFCQKDIEDALPIFQAAANNNGVLVLSLELPMETAIHAIKQANNCGLRVILDPGGLRPEVDHSKLFDLDIFLIKPNEHEALMLTGIAVRDGSDAEAAAARLTEMGCRNIFITLGAQGAYLVTGGIATHIPIPAIASSVERDETGCGDQTMATLCACLIQGRDLQAAARLSILAGTMQFFRAGIIPVTQDQLDSQLARANA
ncbi:MAG: PfkB family carbohydrate kinase, partial [Acidobacteriales bacterium]|nr:PfkB family carbohydrate kinase [Terriglobales bacterium]